ncbi:WS/DGAT/MGAT family O-acyltransferase [Nocardia nova]|uniref:WS/DGAT/MGAT family O-acyltransferase n=1 Tax=Nocardia nova TaxID=37330 RepID=UPI0018962E50|nr:wax ester/triacylglycerol synthase family O-acyltransferase [Nocardia nova]MBF6149523.1 wax ester/triacylglycerol synthase family O-acyltransferase [Nocardia nova]
MTKTFLNLFDAAWFFVERGDAPAHFGPLIILSPPAGAPATYVGDLVAQWRASEAFAPPFNTVLRKKPIPCWETVPDQAIDLDYHLRHIALPAPGGQRELGVLVSHLHSLPLDRRRPLWECHVIEGLEHGRFAVYLKFHHGQLDGVATARLIGRIFSTDPDARDLLPPWSAGIRGNGPSRRPIATQTAASTVSAWGRFGAVERFGRAIGSVAVAGRALVDMALAVRADRTGDLTRPFQAATALFNHRICDQRRFATQHYDLARFKRVAKTANVTVNDVFLTAFGGALQRYLWELDAVPDGPIVGQIPVNMRELNAATTGNVLAFIFARLRTDISDPVVRLQAVHRSTIAAKGFHQTLPPSAVTPFTLLLMGPQMALLIAGLGGIGRPPANLVISNVPGPVEPLYFNGAQVEEIYGPSVLFHGQALNVTMSSYAGKAVISFTACSKSVPHVQRLAVYTGEALEEIEAALGIEQLPESVAPQETSA